jgi:hypothetical protein
MDFLLQRSKMETKKGLKGCGIAMLSVIGMRDAQRENDMTSHFLVIFVFSIFPSITLTSNLSNLPRDFDSHFLRVFGLSEWAYAYSKIHESIIVHAVHILKDKFSHTFQPILSFLYARTH